MVVPIHFICNFSCGRINYIKYPWRNKLVDNIFVLHLDSSSNIYMYQYMYAIGPVTYNGRHTYACKCIMKLSHNQQPLQTGTPTENGTGFMIVEENNQPIR